jgi:two-component system, chemotaxis family, response regulator Rcp1
MPIQVGPHAFDLNAYLEAHQRAFMWAEKAIMYRIVGNFSQAEAALEGVRYWLCRIELMDKHDSRGRVDLKAPPAVCRTVRHRNPCFAVVSHSKGSLTMPTPQLLRAAQVLLVEDSPGDVRLTQEAFHNVNADLELHVATDGVEAMDFLYRERRHIDAPRPDLVLLDLNLPRLDGREVLALVKKDSTLKAIPVVVLSTSDAEIDIATSYNLHANCYFTKPADLDDFDDLVRKINEFWIKGAKLPQRVASC